MDKRVLDTKHVYHYLLIQPSKALPCTDVSCNMRRKEDTILSELRFYQVSCDKQKISETNCHSFEDVLYV
jgi:hypothetical protein